MKIINRLDEIHVIRKFSKYLNNKLISAVNKELSLNLVLDYLNDDYTYTYRAMLDGDNSYTDVVLKFTTNRKGIDDGICWATFMIFGIKVEVGSLTGDLDYDLSIIEDSYYDYFEDAGNRGIIPRF